MGWDGVRHTTSMHDSTCTETDTSALIRTDRHHSHAHIHIAWLGTQPSRCLNTHTYTHAHSMYPSTCERDGHIGPVKKLGSVFFFPADTLRAWHAPTEHKHLCTYQRAGASAARCNTGPQQQESGARPPLPFSKKAREETPFRGCKRSVQLKTPWEIQGVVVCHGHNRVIVVWERSSQTRTFLRPWLVLNLF